MREGGEASQTGLGSPGTSFRRVKTQKQHENRYRTVQGVGRLENATRGRCCPASPGRGAGHNHGVGGGGGPAPRPARRGKEHPPSPKDTKNVPRSTSRGAFLAFGAQFVAFGAHLVTFGGHSVTFGDSAVTLASTL